MAAPGKHRRNLAAQLDGAARRLEVIESRGTPDEIEAQQGRIEQLRAEIEAHDDLHGAPGEQGSGGLWGTTGPARYDNGLYSSGPTR